MGMAKKKEVSGPKKWLLAIGIALVFTMFINYGIEQSKLYGNS